MLYRCAKCSLALRVFENRIKILTGKLTENIPLGRHRWKGNIRMDVKEIGVNTRNLIHCSQDSPCESDIELVP